MPTPDTNGNNQRVTNAVLQNEIKHLTEEVKAMCAKMDRRMNFLEEKHEVDMSELRARCQEHGTQIARLDERQKATTGILGIIQAATIAVSTWFGLS